MLNLTTLGAQRAASRKEKIEPLVAKGKGNTVDNGNPA